MAQCQCKAALGLISLNNETHPSTIQPQKEKIHDCSNKLTILNVKTMGQEDLGIRAIEQQVTN